jgi:hypothetical protein
VSSCPKAFLIFVSLELIMTKLFRIFILLAVPGLLALAACNRFEDDVMPLRSGSQVLLQDDAYIATKNKALRLNVLANDTVFTNGTLLFRQPAHGTISSDSAGFVYRPSLNYLGKDQFYYLYNTASGSDSARVSVTVLDSTATCPINAVNDQVSVVRSQQVDIYILANDQVCGNESISLVTAPQHGTASLMPNKAISYTPSPTTVAQTDTFSYKITTPAGISKRAVVWVMITIPSCIPIANNDIDTTWKGNSIIVKPLQNDQTCGGNGFLYVQTQPLHGTATVLSNTEIQYSPDPNYNGSGDFFQYRFCGQGGGCSTGTVNIAFSPPPCVMYFAALPDSIILPANGAATSFNFDVLQNDTYCTSPLPAMSILQNGQYGTASVVVVGGKPQVNYLKTNPPGQVYSDQVRYQICLQYNGFTYCKDALLKIRFQ